MESSEKKTKIYITHLLLGLYILALTLSISAMDLVITIICVYCLIQYFLNKDKSLFWRNGLEYSWGALVVIVVMGFIFTAASDAPWLKQLLRFNWILYLYSLAGLFLYLNPSAKYFKLVLYWFILLGILGVIQHFNGIEVFRDMPKDRWLTSGGFRVSGFLGSPMVYAHSFGMFLCFFLAHVFSFGARHPFKYLLYLAIFLTGMCVIFSFTRGVWLGVLFACYVMSILCSRHLFYKVLVLSFIFAGTLYASLPYVSNRVNSITITDKEDQSNYGRILIWKTNLQIFKESPWIGIGMNENQRRSVEFHKKFGRSDAMEGHAHNQYLQWLAGTGILGLLAYLSMIFILLWQNIKLIKDLKSSANYWLQSLALGCLGVQICFYVGGITEANFERAPIRHVFIFFMALLIFLVKKQSLLSKVELK